MIVREALVPDPRVLASTASVREAAELLSRPNVRSVLVVDGRRLVGCVTVDEVVAAVAAGRELEALTAGDICEPDVASIAPDAPLAAAARLMSDRNLERLPVVEEGRLVGVLPRELLVRRLAEEDAPAEPESA